MFGLRCAHGVGEPDEELPGAPQHHRGGDRQLHPRLDVRRQRRETQHRDREQRQGQRHRDPEPPCHGPVLAHRGVVAGGRHHRLQVHATDRAPTRLVPHDLRMHRARVLNAARRLVCGSRRRGGGRGVPVAVRVAVFHRRFGRRYQAHAALRAVRGTGAGDLRVHRAHVTGRPIGPLSECGGVLVPGVLVPACSCPGARGRVPRPPPRPPVPGACRTSGSPMGPAPVTSGCIGHT